MAKQSASNVSRGTAAKKAASSFKGPKKGATKKPYASRGGSLTVKDGSYLYKGYNTTKKSKSPTSASEANKNRVPHRNKAGSTLTGKAKLDMRNYQSRRPTLVDRGR